MSYFRTGIVAAAGDVTVSDASGTIASTTVNGALTELSLRNPLTPGLFVVACVDYDGRVLAGNDTTGAVGIGTTVAAALNAAKLTPFKTYERLAQVMPQNGNGANMYVLGKGRTSGASYRNMANTADQGASWRNAFTGYNRICCRSTADFTDTAAERLQLGFVPATGTNATGYNPTGTPTVSVISCQLNGGGAANLPAEGGGTGTSSITGYRIRFDAATSTVALRNVCAMIYKNSTTQLTLGTALATAPSTSDVFYIETTELQFGTFTCKLNDSAVSNYIITGERYLVGGSMSGPPSSIVLLSACESLGACSFIRMCDVSMFTNFIGPEGTASAVGTGGRWVGNMNNSDMMLISINSAAIIGSLTLTNIVRFTGLCSASVIANGFIHNSPGGSVNNNNSGTQPSSHGIGNFAAAGAAQQRTRITAAGASGAGILVVGTGLEIRGVDIANQTGPVIQISQAVTASQGCSIVVDDVVSTDGNNTGPVLKMAGQNSLVRWGLVASNTITAARDIDMSNGAAVCTFAGLATTNYFDDLGNNVIGSAGIIQDKPGKVVTNRTATTAIGQIIRSNATSNEGTIAKADTAANAAGIIGVALNAAAAAAGLLIAPPGSFAAVQFDSAPTAGNIGYLSTANVGNAQASAPAVSGTNQKNRLGIVQKVSGSFGYMTFNPDKLAITADGAA